MWWSSLLQLLRGISATVLKMRGWQLICCGMSLLSQMWLRAGGGWTSQATDSQRAGRAETPHSRGPSAEESQLHGLSDGRGPLKPHKWAPDKAENALHLESTGPLPPNFLGSRYLLAGMLRLPELPPLIAVRPLETKGAKEVATQMLAMADMFEAMRIPETTEGEEGDELELPEAAPWRGRLLTQTAGKCPQQCPRKRPERYPHPHRSWHRVLRASHSGGMLDPRGAPFPHEGLLTSEQWPRKAWGRPDQDAGAQPAG